MKILFVLLFGFLSIVHVSLAQPSPASGVPPTPKRPVTDTYFGKAVVDNYRWLEDMNNQEVKDWFKAQSDYTNDVLSRIPGRTAILNKRPFSRRLH